MDTVPAHSNKKRALLFIGTGATGRNGHRPIESKDLQAKRAIGRTGGETGNDKLAKHENVPLSFDAKPNQMTTLRELREAREQATGAHSEPGIHPESALGNLEGKERSQVLAEGLSRLLKEHPEYQQRRPAQIACRLHMSRYTSFVPTDEEVEAAMKGAT